MIYHAQILPTIRPSRKTLFSQTGTKKGRSEREVISCWVEKLSYHIIPSISTYNYLTRNYNKLWGKFTEHSLQWYLLDLGFKSMFINRIIETLQGLILKAQDCQETVSLKVKYPWYFIKAFKTIVLLEGIKSIVLNLPDPVTFSSSSSCCGEPQP